MRLCIIVLIDRTLRSLELGSLDSCLQLFLCRLHQRRVERTTYRQGQCTLGTSFLHFLTGSIDGLLLTGDDELTGTIVVGCYHYTIDGQLTKFGIADGLPSIDIKGILDGTVADVPLRNEDVLYIASREEKTRRQTVTINGEVHYPGVYKYADNESVDDLILQAGGPTEAASTVKVDVARRVSNPSATEAEDMTAETFSFQLTPGFSIAGQPDFRLMPFDEVYVRRSPNYTEQQNVTLEGEVQFEGTYALSNKGQRLSEVIRQAGGLTKRAYPEGAKLLRLMTHDEQDMMETVLRTAQRNSGRDSIDVKKLMLNANYPVGIELDKALKNPGSDDDPILREGDRIIVPRYDGTVKINGEVLFPNTVFYKEGKDADYYIGLAGGTTSTAKKSRTVIIYMNGMVARADRKHKPAPGCQIVVPTKRQRHGLGLQEWLSIGTSTASLGTMIATIANLTK